MIQVEGYKAFRGKMRITPMNPKFPQQKSMANGYINLSITAGMGTDKVLWLRSVRLSQTKHRPANKSERMINNAHC